jgi:hypothetical protein
MWNEKLIPMELRAQLHMHTTESKGTRIEMECNIHPKKAVDILKKKNIQVAAITDHNNTRAYPKIKDYAEKKGIILINGIEVSTEDGELIGLNVEPGIEKELKKGIDLLEAKDIILSHGGEILIPHPFDMMGRGIGKRIKDVKGIVEVFNPGNVLYFEDKFARIVAEKLGLPMVACSDAHWLEMIDRGVTVVDCEPDVDSVFESIKKGKVKFENCEYLSWDEIKNWSIMRVIESYPKIRENLKNGWEVDCTYMKIANQRMIRLLERAILEFSFKKPKSKVLDFLAFISHFFTSFYGWRRRREYMDFISLL